MADLSSMLGNELVDLTGLKHKVVGANCGPYNNLLRLQSTDFRKREILISEYELRHYYK